MKTPVFDSPRMTGQQITALVVLLISQFIIAADFSVINVALPQVGAELGFADPDLQWIATTFALCAAGCTLVFGRIGDFLGRRRIFLAGMALLAVSSLVGGLASTPTALLAARTLQGLATAALLPASLALLTTTFTEPGQRARALGLNSVMMSSGFVAGSILGGVLADLLSWRWAFFVNIPVAIAAVVVVPLVVSESRSHEHRRIDIPGALLITGGLVALVLSVSHAGEAGFDPFAVAAMGVAAVLLTLFWVVESRTTDALVPVAVLRLPEVAWSSLAGVLMFAGETALIFFTGLWVQEVLGLSPLATGLVLLGIGVGQIIAGAAGPRLLQIVSPRLLLGTALIGQGLFMLPLLVADSEPGGVVLVVATQFVNGAFSMIAVLSYMVLTTAAVGTDQQGMATGLAMQSQQVGMAIGIPLLSAVLTTALGGVDLGPASVEALHVAIGVDAAVLIAAGVLLVVVLRRRD